MESEFKSQYKELLDTYELLRKGSNSKGFRPTQKEFLYEELVRFYHQIDRLTTEMFHKNVGLRYLEHLVMNNPPDYKMTDAEVATVHISPEEFKEYTNVKTKRNRLRGFVRYLEIKLQKSPSIWAEDPMCIAGVLVSEDKVQRDKFVKSFEVPSLRCQSRVELLSNSFKPFKEYFNPTAFEEYQEKFPEEFIIPSEKDENAGFFGVMTSVNMYDYE